MCVCALQRLRACACGHGACVHKSAACARASHAGAKFRPDAFNLVIVVSSDRTREFDTFLVKQLKATGTPFAFDRTKFDEAVAANAEDRGVDEATTHAEVVADVVKNIGAEHKSQVFCTSSRRAHQQKFDMVALKQHIRAAVRRGFAAR